MAAYRRAAAAAAAYVLCLTTASARADVLMTVDVERGIPPSLFSNGMVLQREMTVPIFGKADPGELVTVSFRGQEKGGFADSEGRWLVELDPMTAGGPFTMTITGNNTIEITDVRVGEVWVAAGQSNMTRKRVKRTILETESDIRTLVRRDWRDQPGLVPYTFAKNLEAALGVPIGILNLASGGSGALYWLGDSAASDPDPDVQPYLVNASWGSLFRKFVKPVLPFRVRGIVWWQGEEDSKYPLRHATLYPAVIRSWREAFGVGDIPWISMQVPTGRGLRPDMIVTALPPSASATDTSATTRQTYVEALEEFQYTSFASSLDLEGGIHPVDTAGYAKRLSDQVLALVYGQDIAYSGPLFSSLDVEMGGVLRVHYRAGTAEGLAARGGGAIQGFAVTEDFVTWHWATAVVDGEDMLVSSPSAPNAVAARYAWGDRPTWANLTNGAGLAAPAFSSEAVPGEWGP